MCDHLTSASHYFVTNTRDYYSIDMLEHGLLSRPCMGGTIEAFDKWNGMSAGISHIFVSRCESKPTYFMCYTLRAETFAHRNFRAQKLSRTETFAHRNFHAQKLSRA